MNCLEERILKDGIVKEGNVLKVDSFLNHQMDIELFNEMAKEWKKRFEGKNINKILTIEASGIGIACIVAQLEGPGILALDERLVGSRCVFLNTSCGSRDVCGKPMDPDNTFADHIVIVNKDQGKGLGSLGSVFPADGEGQLRNTLNGVTGQLAVLFLDTSVFKCVRKYFQAHELTSFS